MMVRLERVYLWGLRYSVFEELEFNNFLSVKSFWCLDR